MKFKKLFRNLPFLKTTADLRDRSWLERINAPSYQKWFVGIIMAILLSLLLSPSLTLHLKEYNVGDIATKEIKSNQDLLIVDERLTQEKRIEAERSVLPVYDYDPSVLSDAEQRIQSVFGAPTLPVRKSRKDAGQEALGLSLTRKEWKILEKEHFSPAIGDAVLKLIAPILKKEVVNDRELLDVDADKGITVRDIQTREERKTYPPYHFLDIRQARAKIRGQATAFVPSMGKETSAVVLKIADHFLRPTLTFNKSGTEQRKLSVKEKLTPVYLRVRRGEMILRPGDRVQEEHLLKINALRKAQARTHLVSILIGMSLLTFLILASLYQFSTKNIRKIALSQKDLLFCSTALLGTIAFFKLFQLTTDVLGEEFFSIPSSSYLYLFPIATGAMLVRIVLNSEVAIAFTLLTGYFSAALAGNQLFYFIFAVVGSLIGAHKVAQCEQRSILIKAGMAVGGINILMILAYNLLSGNPFRITIFADLLMAFLGGPLASVLVLGMAPIVESIFGYTTDIKLLELASMDHPLLKDLILQAPGTYHHSIIVGTLVEAAAKSIAANPLLTRVSAYYHDVGKLKKPLYFIENVVGGEDNKHNHLTATMSSLILISHVKDGVEMARENRLGERIGHIIQQHHGTSLISFFYQKAKEKENPEMESIDEKDFRYPGPKPQTKEAGIVMLADSVEAASRTLTDPTPSRINSLVQRVTNSIFLDGQMEECELTLKDLQKIQESFNRILTAIFHQRIDYPVSTGSETKKKNDEDLDSKSAKTYPLRLKKDKKGGPKAINGVGAS